MVAGLLDRRFDLALITLPFPTDKLVVTPLFEEELLIVQHCGNTLARLASGRHQTRTTGRCAVPALSETQQYALDYRRFLGGDRREAPRHHGGGRYRRHPAHGGIGLRIFHPARVCAARSARQFRVFRVPGRKISRTQALAMVETEHPRALTLAVGRSFWNCR